MDKYDSVERIASRINALIESRGLKQKEFADSIGMANGSLSTICSGKNGPSNSTILNICNKYKVNEAWLRFGTLPIYLELDKEDEIIEWVANVMKLPLGSPQKRLFSALARLPEEDWKMVARLMDDLIEVKKSDSSDNK